MAQKYKTRLAAPGTKKRLEQEFRDFDRQRASAYSEGYGNAVQRPRQMIKDIAPRKQEARAVKINATQESRMQRQSMKETIRPVRTPEKRTPTVRTKTDNKKRRV